MLKDDPNIVFSNQEGEVWKRVSKLRRFPPKFKFRSYSNANLEDIRRMVNEIEEGVYINRNEKIQQFNATPKKSHLGTSSILKKSDSFKSHKLGKVVEVRKMMPKFTKVERVPNPDSKIFEKFE